MNITGEELKQIGRLLNYRDGWRALMTLGRGIVVGAFLSAMIITGLGGASNPAHPYFLVGLFTAGTLVAVVGWRGEVGCKRSLKLLADDIRAREIAALKVV